MNKISHSTTYFIGTHYEVTSAKVTKYYYAGSQRIAMRQDGTLMFIIGDHLGSTSLVTDDQGTVISDTKYKAWGEVRYSSNNSPTKYSYTGQYSYVRDFGLMFYNARWYDSSLSRFAQADTIVPSGVQGYDRYSYVGNNPIVYLDPSGHIPVDCIASTYCGAPKDPTTVVNSQLKPKAKKPAPTTPISISPETINSLANYAVNEPNISASVPSQSDVAGRIGLLVSAANGYSGLTLEEIAYILASAHWESHFGYGSMMWEDLSDNPDGYEGNLELGNIYPGDGRWFRGRGFIQITGRYAYTHMSQQFGIDLVNNPDLVATDYQISAAVSVNRMVDGAFDGTYYGPHLSDFRTTQGYDFVGARAIINGGDTVENAQTIAGIASGYLEILQSYTGGQ